MSHSFTPKTIARGTVGLKVMAPGRRPRHRLSQRNDHSPESKKMVFRREVEKLSCGKAKNVSRRIYGEETYPTEKRKGARRSRGKGDGKAQGKLSGMRTFRSLRIVPALNSCPVELSPVQMSGYR